MKYLITLLTILVLFSCTKEAPNQGGQNPFYVPGGTVDTTTNPTPNPINVPLSFTKKVLLEEGTGEWCGWCPEGAKIMEDNIAANPNTVIGSAVHDGDPMEIPFNSWWKSAIQLSGFPNGSVDRANATGRGSWTAQINTNLTKTAVLGLKIENKSVGGLLDIDVYVGYNTPVSASNLTVLLTENDVPQSFPGAQANYSSTVVVGPGWLHSHVLRALLTANEGNSIDLSSSENFTKASFSGIDISSYNENNLHIVAFVSDATGVLNVQEASINENKDWD